MNSRIAIVQNALNFLGAKKGDTRHKEILDIYNSIVPLPRGHAMSSSEAWCAAFVSAMAWKTGLGDIFPFECSCGSMVQGLKLRGAWVEDDNYKPKTGDLVFYAWYGKEGENLLAPNHVGIVIENYENGFKVIEGNYSHQVKIRTVPYGWVCIRGFGTPDYEGHDNHEPEIDKMVSEWARDDWKHCVKAGVLENKYPQAYVTREVLACVISRILDKLGE